MHIYNIQQIYRILIMTTAMLRDTGPLVLRGDDPSERLEKSGVKQISIKRSIDGIDAFHKCLQGIDLPTLSNKLEEHPTYKDVETSLNELLLFLFNPKRLSEYSTEKQKNHEILSLGRHSTLSAIINLLLFENLQPEDQTKLLNEFFSDLENDSYTPNEIKQLLFYAGLTHDTGKGINEIVFNTVMQNGAIKSDDPRKNYVFAHPVIGWYGLNEMGFPLAFQKLALLHQVRVWEENGNISIWGYPINSSSNFIFEQYLNKLPPSYVQLFMIADSIASIVGKKPEHTDTPMSSFSQVTEKLYQRYNPFEHQYGLRYRKVTDTLINIMSRTFEDIDDNPELDKIIHYLANTYDYSSSSQAHVIPKSTDYFTGIVVSLARNSANIQQILRDLYPEGTANNIYLQIYDERFTIPTFNNNN